MAASRVAPQSSGSHAGAIIAGIAAVLLIGGGVVFLLPTGRGGVTPGPKPPVTDNPQPGNPKPSAKDPAREARAEQVWVEGQTRMEQNKWPEALIALGRLTGELSDTSYVTSHRGDIDKAIAECRAKIDERKNTADGLEKRARDSLASKKWMDASDAYTTLINDYADLKADQIVAFRDALAICDRESQVESLLKDVTDAIAKENWEIARAALVRLTQSYASSITLSTKQGEISAWEKQIRDELSAETGIEVLRREVDEKKWAEARKTLGDIRKLYAATATLRKRKADVDALEAKITQGVVVDAEKLAAAQLKAADDAFAAKKWTLARETYIQVKADYAAVPLVMSRMSDITKRIADCENNLRQVVEHSAVAVWALANDYYRSNDYSNALIWYEKLTTDYKDTKVYKDKKTDIAKRIADCIAKGGKKE
jgi:hypothetical protein